MAVSRYRARLSGPLLDPLDLLDVPALGCAEIHASRSGEGPVDVRERVTAAGEAAARRRRCTMAALASSELRRLAKLPQPARALLQGGMDRAPT